MIVRAQFVLPMTGLPIEDGAVLVHDSRIVKVGRAAELHSESREEWLDLGDAVLLPGLINAHCHLELTDLAGKVPCDDGFTDWLKNIVAAKRDWEHAQYEKSALHGVEMLLAAGTTSVCDVISWWPAAARIQSDKLRVWSCLEMIDFAGQRSWRDWVSSAEGWFAKLPNSRGGWGFSPHAPYTATADLYRAGAELQRRSASQPLLMATHIGESADEREMFEEGGGALYEWLVRVGRDMYDCGGVSSLEMLHGQHVLNNHTLGIHLNGLDADELNVVADCGMSVVHCPSSHRFFGHPPFGLEQLLARGVNVCVGTDSLASAPAGTTLDLFAELRLLRRAFPNLSAETILRLATVNGAKALHAADRLGTIERGKWADLIALRLPARAKESDVHELVVSGQLPLCLVAIHGELIRGNP